MGITVTDPKSGKSLTSTLSDADAVRLVGQIRDNAFALNLYNQHSKYGRLSASQWFWVHKLAAEVQGSQQADAPDVAPETRPVSRDVQLPSGSFSRVKAMFDLAHSNGIEYPKLRFITSGGKQIQLSVCGEKSRTPGAVNVTSVAAAYHMRTWHGVVMEGDTFRKSSDCTDAVADFVWQFFAYPDAVATAHGLKTGVCCFCARKLTDERSVYMGRGPVCSAKWGLPYGERPPKTEYAL